MGLLTDMFVATEDEIDDAVLEEGPADRFPTVEAKGVEIVKLTSLNGIATGRSYDLDDGGFDRLSAEVPMIRYGARRDHGSFAFRRRCSLRSRRPTGRSSAKSTKLGRGRRSGSSTAWPTPMKRGGSSTGSPVSHRTPR
jgi:hypothetical protein